MSFGASSRPSQTAQYFLRATKYSRRVLRAFGVVILKLRDSARYFLESSARMHDRDTSVDSIGGV